MKITYLASVPIEGDSPWTGNPIPVQPSKSSGDLIILQGNPYQAPGSATGTITINQAPTAAGPWTPTLATQPATVTDTQAPSITKIQITWTMPWLQATLSSTQQTSVVMLLIQPPGTILGPGP